MKVSINSINFEREMIFKTCQFGVGDIFGRLSSGTYYRTMHNKYQNSAYKKNLSITLKNLIKYYPTRAVSFVLFLGGGSTKY